MFQDETDENVVEGFRSIRQIEDIRLLKLNVGKACRSDLSPGFRNRGFGYIDRSNQGIRAVFRKGDRLRAHTATGIQNTASCRIEGV